MVCYLIPRISNTLDHLVPHCCLAHPSCNSESLNSWGCPVCIVSSAEIPPKPFTTKAIRRMPKLLKKKMLQSLMFCYFVPRNCVTLDHLAPHCCLSQPSCNDPLLECCKLESLEVIQVWAMCHHPKPLQTLHHQSNPPLLHSDQKYFNL